MSSNALFFAVFLFFDGVALAWAAWEYWQIRPGKADKSPDNPKQPDGSPEDPGHPEG